MNENLQGAIADSLVGINKQMALLIENSLKVMSDGAAFAREQLPDVLNQLLLWHAVKSAVLFLLIFPVIAFAFWLMKRIRKQWEERVAVYERLIESAKKESRYLTLNMDKVQDEGSGRTLFTIVIFSATAIVCYSLFNLTWLQILLAPKLYLIEYMTRLLG